ncbi:MAG TPA: alpha/beta hydrolase-fold protein [Bacteroidota bacterium]
MHPAHLHARVLLLGGLLALLIGPATARCQLFDAFIARVSSASENARTALVDSFLAAHPTDPLLEGDSAAIFFFRGADSSVALAGDANVWNPSTRPLNRLSTTDLWYRQETYEPDARLDYKFVLNGNTWILDPRNPRTQPGGFGPNSELRMPRYPDPVETRPDSSIPHGSFFDTTLTGPAPGNTRAVRVYLPAGYAGSRDSFRVVLLHDGLYYLSLGAAKDILDYLIAHKRIRPLIGVFVPAITPIRHDEYAASRMPAFASFIANDVMAWVDARFKTMKNPAMRAVAGASDGGNISLYLGLRYPALFGNVCAQSSNVNDSVRNGFANGPRRNLRLWLDLGTYDIPMLLPLVRNLESILRQKGYDHRYVEVHEGHSWGSWKGHLGRALEFFFPGEALTAPPTVPH